MWLWLKSRATAGQLGGTCPIDLEGHPWAERFAVVVDLKGKIKTTDHALL